jgi:predicted RecB family nuclease
VGQGIDAEAEVTRETMREGATVIYQACLRTGNVIGYVDFLRRVDTPSDLGQYSYEVVDTKLARSPKAKFILQLCLYAELLADVQGVLPRHLHLANYFHYYRKVKARFLEAVSQAPGSTYPLPCAHCDLCDWRELCRHQWEQDDHLVLVANITRNQIGKLNAAAIATLTQLARLKEHRRVPRLQPETLERLRHQAALQLARRGTGENRLELIEADPAGLRGFNRLPRPDPGDLFFDMEGDPLEEDGLEYLFGVYFLEDGMYRFRPFWAHDRQQERQAFQDFMAFVMKRLARFPRMHIYHYAAYEATALKRLMSLHGVCEAEVDQLLRTERLVDLYKVVREGVRVTEPRYSIKNLEAFYMGKRTGEVTNAGASIVYYEHWKATAEQALLDRIRDYNEDDCRSTYLLREWLLKIRPASATWFEGTPVDSDEAVKSERVRETEARLADYHDRLLGGLPADRARWNEAGHVRELLYQLLDFHRRAAKPEWWAMFARQEMTAEELMDDPECIGGMRADADHPPEQVKRSILYTYRFPEQEYKFKEGDICRRADTLELAGSIIELNEADRSLCLKLGMMHDPLPEHLSIIPQGPISTSILTEALYRVADSLLAGASSYAALRAILSRHPPSIDGHVMGQPILAETGNVTAAVIDAVRRLRESHLFIQGPPGAGKTYTGSHVVTALLAKAHPGNQMD